jgi:DNA-binding FadR family transcriptional regulator
VNAPRSVSNSSDPRFREIPRERVSDRVANELLKLIGDGRLTPGERLPGERQLATMMGVSRVSIRAALQQLKEQGLLSAVQGGGTRLLAAAREIDPDVGQLLRIDAENLNDLIAIRTVLEVWAARRAAERATTQQIADLENAHRELAQSGGDRQRRAEGDVRFHRALARASGSKVYLHLMERLRDTLEATLDYQRSEILRSPEEEQAVVAQHGAIVAAIRDRDPAAAAAAAQAHLDFVRDRHRGNVAAAASQAAE